MVGVTAILEAEEISVIESFVRGNATVWQAERRTGLRPTERFRRYHWPCSLRLSLLAVVLRVATSRVEYTRLFLSVVVRRSLVVVVMK